MALSASGKTTSQTLLGKPRPNASTPETLRPCGNSAVADATCWSVAIGLTGSTPPG